MKKTILIGITLVLLIGLTFAGVGLIKKDKTVTLSNEAEQFYKDRNITPSYEDYTEGGFYERCLISNTKFNLPCSGRFKGTINETKLDQWQKERLEGIAQVQIGRDNKPAKEKVMEGDITISK